MCAGLRLAFPTPLDLAHFKKKENMRKILVIGSAPYIVRWYNKHRSVLLRDGYTICAINNAWAVSREDTQVWFHSTDFFTLDNTVKPDIKKDMLKTWEITHYKAEPYWYDKQESGTMILNVLAHILNELVTNKVKGDVFIAGCDLNYNNVINHFYCNGQNDPMRFGEDYLVNELIKMGNNYEHEGIGIYNVGGREDSLLPFKRIEIC